MPHLCDAVARDFATTQTELAAMLEQHGATLLPTAMHPLMNPATETKLWPHGDRTIYEAFDRLFGCGGHGWANLQSVHLNLPFDTPEAFGRLHAAIRAVLPLIPALAASSPFREGRVGPALDGRLVEYLQNQRRFASIMGQAIPEPVFTPDDYQREILEPMYAEIAPHDAEGLLQYEWLNSRGAIARFDRDAIEIRLIDAQEAPIADLAVCWAVAELVRALSTERWVSQADLRSLAVAPLRATLDDTVRDADQAWIENRDLLRVLGRSATRLRARDLWIALVEELRPTADPTRTGMHAALDVVLEQGPLARRILQQTGPEPAASEIREVYDRLATCLRANRSYDLRTER